MKTSGNLWRENEIRDLIRWTTVDGLATAEIAKRLGRTVAAVNHKIKNLCLKRPGDPWVRRPCLTCGTSFCSEGSHNRICETCKARRDWTHAEGYGLGVEKGLAV